MKIEVLTRILPFFVPFILLVPLLGLYDLLKNRVVKNQTILLFGIIAPLTLLIILLLKSYLLPKEVYLMETYPYLCHGGIKTSVLSSLIAGICYGIFLRRNSITYLITVVYSFILCVVLARGPLPIEEFLSGDNWYLTTGINRYIQSWHLIDFTSKNNITFYPPLQSFIFGKIAGLFNIKAYQILQLGNLATITFSLYLLFYININRINGYLNVIIVAIISCFFIEEIAEKPYQIASACLSLLYYFEIEKMKTSTKRGILLGVLGGILALYYYYFFVIMAIAWAIRLVWLYHSKSDQSLKKEHFSKLIPYGISLIILLSFFLVPLYFDINAATTKTPYFAYYGSLMDLQWPENFIYYFPGLLFIVTNYKFNLNLLFFVLGICALSVIHIFTQFTFLNSLRVIKLNEFYPIVFIPFTLMFINEALPRLLGTTFKNDSIYKVLLLIVAIFSFNFSANRFYKPENIKTHDSSLLNEIESIQSNLDLNNKLIYTLNYYDRLEYGPLINTYRFMPVNIDYAAPGFDYDLKAAFIANLITIDNPAEVALLLLNNPFAKIDYVAINNRVTVQLPYQMGFAPMLVDSLKGDGWISSKYFPIANQSYSYLRRVDYQSNFIEKPVQQLNVLEKLARKINIENLSEQLASDIKAAQQFKDTAYLESIRYYLTRTKGLTEVDKSKLLNLLLNSKTI